ncbi:Lrp/AsnC family transcriptional regulator [Plantactinospora sp. B6F1]|uniref:Lrp/AsnC family transcriptional regulator n=1 Tax=Plantactinospora sp. B6F1 TaxID=3158971 RepID=UPI0032D998A2
MTTVQDVRLDWLDVRLIDLLAAEPRIGVLECSRRLQVARGTVQARLDKLLARGVIAGLGPQLDPAALGFAVTSFVTLEINQRSGHDPVTAHLLGIPEVLEAHTITGSGDVLCRIVARSNADLQRVLDQIVAHEQIARASSIIALAEKIPYRVLPLLRSAVDAAPEGAGSATGASGGAGASEGAGSATSASPSAVRS